jgi:predicted O-methyltransferase YrrM
MDLRRTINTLLRNGPRSGQDSCTASESREFAHLIKTGVSKALGRTRYAYNLVHVAKLRAAFDSAEYYAEKMSTAAIYKDRKRILDSAPLHTLEAGLILEFGVASGKSINRLARAFPKRKLHGFDSFKGLPETWRPNFRTGHFAQDVPPVAESVTLHVGWFEDTLPRFVSDHQGATIALLHVDCDLYSSTKTIFEYLEGMIAKGTVILFDEYLNYPNWRQHEYKAFQELVAAKGIQYEYLGLVPGHSQVMVRITDIKSA